MTVLPDTLDLDALPNMEVGQIEAIINNLSFDTALGLLNMARQRQIDDPARVVPDPEIVAGLLLARRLRTHREQKSTTARAAKPRAPAKPAVTALDLGELCKPKTA